ncbi:hypothetical protein DFQ29_009000 [Apophysomyces sp. BC1021]|nr:hypothetical protein DFQ29_009000 [Apophysomyces sp. BC1021]
MSCTIEEIELSLSLSQRAAEADLIRRPRRFNPVDREILVTASKDLIRDLVPDPAGDLATGVVKAIQNALDQVSKTVINDVNLEFHRREAAATAAQPAVTEDVEQTSRLAVEEPQISMTG